MKLPNQHKNFTLCLNIISSYIHSFKHCLLMIRIIISDLKVDEGEFLLPDGDLFSSSWLPDLDEKILCKDFGMDFDSFPENILKKGWYLLI